MSRSVAPASGAGSASGANQASSRDSALILSTASGDVGARIVAPRRPWLSREQVEKVLSRAGTGVVGRSPGGE